ncbi:MAG: glycosyltransferase family 2 protein [Bacteroidota bacterium]
MKIQEKNSGGNKKAHSAWENTKYRISVIKNRLRTNLIDVEPGESRIKKILFYASKKGRVLYRVFTAFFRALYILSERRPITILRHYKGQIETVYSSNPYDLWIAKHVAGESLLLTQKRAIKQLVRKPHFYFILPLEPISVNALQQTIDSVLKQIYPNFSLICVAGSDTDPESVRYVEEKGTLHQNISIHKTATRAADVHAKNELLQSLTWQDSYLSILKSGDAIAPNTLFLYAKTLNNTKIPADVLYTDDDCISDSLVRFDPRFKQQWNPDTFTAQNYIGNAWTIKTEWIRNTGGWNPDYESAHEFELLARICLHPNTHISSIPEVCYSVLVTDTIDNSVNDSVEYRNACKAAIQQTLTQYGESCSVTPAEFGDGFSVKYTLTEAPLVSIIIPTKDKIEVLEKCIDSIFAKSTYLNFEVILIDNNSSHDTFFTKVKEWEKLEPLRFRCIRTEHPFNFSFLMNLGASHAKGKQLILLNNDTEVITPNWIEGMLEQAQRASIGVVGVKLLYPNDTVQHAGVIVGLGGGAGHVFIGKEPNAVTYMNYLNHTTNYSAVTAACWMVNKEKYDSVGGFDEQFAVEFNDVDFCLRIKEKGYNNVYLPHVELYHYESISRGHPLANKVSFERHVSELHLLQTRWRKTILNDPCYSPNLSLDNENMDIRV